MYLYECMCVYESACSCVCVRLYVCVCVCVRARTSTCTCACVDICVFVCAKAQTHTCTRTHSIIRLGHLLPTSRSRISSPCNHRWCRVEGGNMRYAHVCILFASIMSCMVFNLSVGAFTDHSRSAKDIYRPVF